MSITYQSNGDKCLEVEGVPLEFSSKQARDTLREALAGYNLREASIPPGIPSGWNISPYPQGNGFVITSPQDKYETDVADREKMTQIYNILRRKIK